VFALRLEAAQVKLVQGETAPALRAAIEQTPSDCLYGDGSGRGQQQRGD
jgi:hypothetical protein